MQKESKLRRLGSWALKLIVILSVAWTFLSLFMLLKWEFSSSSHFSLAAELSNVEIKLPTLSPDLIFQDLPGIQLALNILETYSDSLEQPVRLSVVYQSDSTYFVELIYVSDCDCPSTKLDRYTITHTVIDPITGIILTRIRDEGLSAERLNRYFGGLTRIRRF